MRKNRTIFYKIMFWSFIISILLFLIDIIFFFDGHYIFGAFSGSFFLFSALLWIIGNLLVRTFVLIGEITITTEKILVQSDKLTTEYLLKDVKNINVIYHGSEAESYNTGYIGILRQKDGTNNFIVFEDINGTLHSFELFIQNAGKLKQALISMERRKIPFFIKK